jgi:hypothetical protein
VSGHEGGEKSWYQESGVVRDPNKHKTTMSSSAAAFDSKSREGEPCHPSLPFTPWHVRSASRFCALWQPIAAHTTDSKQRLSECSDGCHILCCSVCMTPTNRVLGPVSLGKLLRECARMAQCCLPLRICLQCRSHRWLIALWYS